MATTETLQQTSIQESAVPDYPDLITIATGETVTAAQLCDRLAEFGDTPEDAQKAWELAGAQNVVRAICAAKNLSLNDSLQVGDVMARDRVYKVRGGDGNWQTEGSMMVAFTTKVAEGEMAHHSFTIDRRHPLLPDWASKVLGKMAFAERLQGNSSFLAGGVFNPFPIVPEAERRSRLFRSDS